MAVVARLHRHPVKSLGWEAIPRATLAPGGGLPWDRAWALAHAEAEIDAGAPDWAPCDNFLIVSISPRLAQVKAAYDPATRTLALSHPDGEPLLANPDAPDGAEAIARWAAPFAAESQPGPFRLVRAPRPMHDTEFPSISIASLSSLRALSERMGVDLDPRRFRANIWIDGLAPWVESHWAGQEIAVGGARLRIVEPIVRCSATETDPDSGRRDARVRAALHETVGAPDFGVYAVVTAGGDVALGDPVEAP